MDDEGCEIDSAMLARLIDGLTYYETDLGMSPKRLFVERRSQVRADRNRIQTYADTRSDRMPNPIFVLVDKQTLNMLRKSYEERE